MDMSLSEEQLAWRESLRRFVDREIAPVAREYEQGGIYPTEILEHMKELGLFGVTVPGTAATTGICAVATFRGCCA